MNEAGLSWRNLECYGYQLFFSFCVKLDKTQTNFEIIEKLARLKYFKLKFCRSIFHAIIDRGNKSILAPKKRKRIMFFLNINFKKML